MKDIDHKLGLLIAAELNRYANWRMNTLGSGYHRSSKNMIDDALQITGGVWCVVANIKRDHPYGEGGIESKSGTRQFRGGTKVYIGGCYAGTCDGVVCVGLHRKSRKFITCVVSVMHVENFRPKVAYHPEVVRRLKEDERCWFQTQEDAQNWAAAFPNWQGIWRPNKTSNMDEPTL